MSVEATAAVWAMRDLSATEKVVAVRLADHAGPDGDNAYPSLERLSLDTGLCERSVRNALRHLESRGVIALQEKKGPKGTNRYVVNLRRGVPQAIKGGQEMPPAGDAPRQEIPSGGAGDSTKGGQEMPPNRYRTVSEPPTRALAREFDAWWQGYPRKVARGAAKKAFAKARKTATVEELMTGLAAAATVWQREGTESRYIPYASTWLNAEHWVDDYSDGRPVPEEEAPWLWGRADSTRSTVVPVEEVGYLY
jgi:hypothetical protein